MVINITFKHMNAKPEIKEYAETKALKLKKYFDGKIHLTFNFDHSGKDHHEEMIAHGHLLGNHMDFFAESKGPDLHVSIDDVINKLERQIRKRKELVKDHLHNKKAG